MTPREQLALFMESVIELRTASLIKKGLSVTIDIGSSAQGKLQFEPRDWPDEEGLRSFLILFRPFISDKEPIFLNRIYNICYNIIKSQKLRNLIADARAKWKRANKFSSFPFKYNGKIYSPEEVVNLIISGKYFHKDENKAKILRALDSSTEVLFKLVFITYIMEGIAHISWMHKIIKHAIKNGLLSE